MILSKEARTEQPDQREPDGRFATGNRLGWVPGQSGNPGGRTRGLSPTAALVKVASMTALEVAEALQDKDLPMAARMALAEWSDAVEYDSKNSSSSRARIYDRCDGPVKDVESAGDDDEQAAAVIVKVPAEDREGLE